MRNLTILSEAGVSLANHQPLSRTQSEERGSQPPLCVDATEQLAYIVAGDNHDTAYLLSTQLGMEGNAAAFNIVAALPFSASSSEIAGMQFLMERESVFLALKSGDIFTIRVGPDAADSMGEQIELVGTVDPGIMASCWSPDEELLALVNGEGKLLLMTQDFDVLDEFALDQSTQGEETHVALGWGKKETQYHGKAGKAAALAPEKEIKVLVTQDDDGQVRISWRGDGAYFAVSFISRQAREIRIFSREGKLQSIAERIEGLEHTMSWRPSGRLIAACEKLDHRYDVVFFERNGLRHGEFTLPSRLLRVLDLSWNSDSSILAITALVETGAEDDARASPEVCVQLWSDKNYHWYLKQEIRSSVLGDAISHAVWDVENPMLIHIACQSSYAAIRLSSSTNTSHVPSEKSNAAACVIDGSKLLYTPFGYANVPPPMALHALEHPQPISHVVFAGFGDGNDFISLLADGTTAVAYKCEHGTAVRDAIPPAEIAQIPIASAGYIARQIVWPARDTIVTLGKQKQIDGHWHDSISIAKLGSATSSYEVVANGLLSLEGIAMSNAIKLTMAPLLDDQQHVLLLETADGHVFGVDFGSHIPSISPIAAFPEPCVDIDAVNVDSSVVVVGRTERNQLFANGHLISPACSSFFLRKDFLLLTTTTHWLRFIPVDSDLTTATLSEDTAAAAKYDETRRRVERGSTIVLASPTSDSVVFQMPRGNLETARPRALVLASRNQLFANGHLISPACSSFFLRKDFLLLTTTTHWLRFIPVDSDLTTATLSEDTAAAAKYDETRRRVERGSTIVLASPTSDSVVFQMPRGNLETARPRALVLASVRRSLERRKYRDALVTCRVNRIDMNIIFDHIPDKLADDLEEFVSQVNDPDLLNLFVSGLRDEDVTVSMYTGAKALQAAAAADRDATVDGKTTGICRKLRPVLQATGDAKFMPTILTTFMCEKPPNISSALQLLAPLSIDERDSALTYLLFLSDVDSVYNAALGLYDLPLALLVAQRSQRDPREYLAALGSLNALPNEEYRRFRIDAQLGRNSLALEHLFASYLEVCSDTGKQFKSEAELWSEIAEFVGEHALFEQAVGMLAGHQRFGDLCLQLGNYQAAKKEWGQAASSYLLGNAPAQAVDAFVQAKDWRAALATASSPESGLSVQAIHGVATKASATLADHHLFFDAATVLLDYTEEDESAVELFVKGGHWQESIRTSLLRGRADLIETTIKPGLMDAYQNIAPFLVRLEVTIGDETSLCGGTLVDKTTVITAAHCVEKSDSKQTMSVDVYYGSNSADNKKHVTSKEDKITMHPKYDKDTVANDIAVIKIPEITLKEGQTESILIYNGKIPAKQQMRIYGWGSTKSDGSGEPKTLMTALVYVSEPKACQADVPDYKDADGPQICTDNNSNAGVDACVGDSGTGTTITSNGKKYYAGLVSYGTSEKVQCAESGKFGLYTHVYQYLTWIETTIGYKLKTGP
ncbi:putative elongator complex protein 1 [Dipsacomyces acuminosporus]|nr:putative elongator complex protein 1 [Dipsacomyces acuminosporus]